MCTHNPNRGGAMSNIKICKDCKHCAPVFLFRDYGPDCWAVTTVNCVTGERLSDKKCSAQRHSSGDCGLVAKLFEPKPYKNKWYFLFMA